MSGIGKIGEEHTSIIKEVNGFYNTIMSGLQQGTKYESLTKKEVLDLYNRIFSDNRLNIKTKNDLRNKLRKAAKMLNII